MFVADRPRDIKAALPAVLGGSDDVAPELSGEVPRASLVGGPDVDVHGVACGRFMAGVASEAGLHPGPGMFRGKFEFGHRRPAECHPRDLPPCRLAQYLWGFVQQIALHRFRDGERHGQQTSQHLRVNGEIDPTEEFATSREQALWENLSCSHDVLDPEQLCIQVDSRPFTQFPASDQ